LKASFSIATKILIAFVFMMAVPLSVAAAPAFANLSLDRTTISHGQTATFTIRVTPQTNFVFATVDGVRVPGTRISGNEWSLTVSPANTTVVTVFANDTNNENGAAVMNIPVTVTGAAQATQQATQHAAVPAIVPAAPANLGPIQIASITETPATRQGFVQLTVVTGAQATDVWANFDRVNNARATGRFARATMLSQDANSRTWTINFDPAVWAAQTVEVGANRSYTWDGAETQAFNLTLAQPFVAPVAPRINSANASPSNVSRGSSVTINVATNPDVEHVWIRDADGREFNATRTTTTTSARNWRVSFTPQRTGTVRVFANATRVEAGAATRNVSVTVGGTGGNDWDDGDAQIVGTPRATWVDRDTTRIDVTTNRYAETVWVTVPGDNRRFVLERMNSGTGNRTWSTEVWDIRSGNIVVSASSSRGNVNNLTAESTRTIRAEDADDGYIISVAREVGVSRNLRIGDWAEFRVVTSTEVDDLEVTGSGGRLQHNDMFFADNRNRNERTWYVPVLIQSGRGDTNFTVRAYVGNTRVDSRVLPAFTITN